MSNHAPTLTAEPANVGHPGRCRCHTERGNSRDGGGREGSARNVYSRPYQRGRPDALTSTFLNGAAAARTHCAQNLLSRYLAGAPRGRLITNGATGSNKAGRVTRK